jgi:hypothetical protein
MGAIYHHDVSSYIKKYDLEYYVETGTGQGDCLTFALKHKFKGFYSVEIYPQIYEIAKNKFKNFVNCEILQGNSYEKLPEILTQLEGNILFFLDAHFPGADFHFETYDSTKDYDTRLPLKKELETIKINRSNNKDVFIIDDLRVYEDNNYTDGNWSLRKEVGGDGIDFVYELFGQSHNIEKDLRYQGYLILTPK